MAIKRICIFAAALLLVAALSACYVQDPEPTESAVSQNSDTSVITSSTEDASGPLPTETTAFQVESDIELPSASQTTSSRQTVPTNTTRISAKPTTTTEAPATTTTSPASASPYARPFNTDGIRDDLIAYGKQIGLTYITHYPLEWGGQVGGVELTKYNVSWWPPHDTIFSQTGENLRRQMKEHLDMIADHGHTYFGLFFEPTSKAGEYTIYIFRC